MSDTIAKVKDEPHLVKDVTSGAVLNVDHKALEMYRARKAQARKLESTVERLDRLEARLDQIVELLLQQRGNP